MLAICLVSRVLCPYYGMVCGVVCVQMKHGHTQETFCVLYFALARFMCATKKAKNVARFSFLRLHIRLYLYMNYSERIIYYV
jgi:hypothetical protein